ncbi:MAG: hypothetical protein AAFN79_18030 [Pseudomonadota bacterium]
MAEAPIGPTKPKRRRRARGFQLFASPVKRLAGHAHATAYLDPRPESEEGPLCVIFSGDRAINDAMVRIWSGRLIVVRPRKDGTFAKGAASLAARISNARVMFTNVADAEATLAMQPGLRTVARLLTRAPASLFADPSILLGLRALKMDGQVDETAIGAPTPLTDITTWLAHPVETAGAGPDGAPSYIFLDTPSFSRPSDEDLAEAVAGGEDGARFAGRMPVLDLIGAGDQAERIRTAAADGATFLTEDVSTSTFLACLGYPAATLRADGKISRSTALSLDGMSLLSDFTATGLYDLRLRRRLSLTRFLYHEAGPYRRYRSLLRLVNRNVPSEEDKLQLISLAVARGTDPSFGTTLGLFLEALIRDRRGESMRAHRALRRLADRLYQAGLTQTPEETADAPQFAQALPRATGDMQIAAPRRIQSFKAAVRDRLIKTGIRTYSRIGRSAGFSNPVARILTRRIAEMGLEEGFRLFAGLSGSKANARVVADDIAGTLAPRSQIKAIIAARLYLSADEAEKGMAVLDGLSNLSAGHHGMVLSCLYRTGRIEEGLAWLDRLPEEVRTKSPISTPAFNLVTNAYGREAAYEFLRPRMDPSAAPSQGLKFLYGRLAAIMRDYDVAYDNLQDIVQTSVENPAALQYWAQAARATGRLRAAVLELQSPRNADHPRAQLLLSYLLAEDGDVMGAMSAALAAFRLDPASSALAANAVSLASTAGGEPLIAEVLERHAKTSADAKVAACMHFTSRRDFDRADHHLSAAREGRAEMLQFTYAEARLRLHQEKFGAAARTLRRALAFDPARLTHVLLACEVAERRRDGGAEAKALADLASLIAPNDFRVLETLARQAEADGDHDQAEERLTRAGRSRVASTLRDDLRNNWSLFKVRAKADTDRAPPAAFNGLVTGLHLLMPPEVKRWDGGRLDGKSVLLVPRGGPGDEVRTLQVAARVLEEMGATISFFGDRRVRDIFHGNFSGGSFHSNPLAGSKLLADEIALRNLPRIQKGTAELARRQHLYFRARLFDEFDEVILADEVVLSHLLPAIFAGTAPDYAPLALNDEKAGRAEEMIAALGPGGPVATISWRGTYFSPNRPSASYLRIDELGPIFAVPGVRFIDTHPNSSDVERREIADRYGVELLRPEGVDFKNDFELTGALMRTADANIVPPVTQRDLAAAVGAPNIWSFDVIPGVSESWRVHEASQTDLWQPGIAHHTSRGLGSRAAVVEALARRLAALAAERSGDHAAAHQAVQPPSTGRTAPVT